MSSDPGSYLERYDERIAESFLKANERVTGLPKYLGIKLLQFGPGRLLAEMPIREELLTPFGNIHGGVMAALVDHVLGVVLYPLMGRGQWAATTEFKLNYLAPAKSGTLVAESRVISMTRTTAVVRIEVTNDGRLACIAQGTVLVRDPKA
jgi:uncharacterized protein (TIGR00369 family)